jgi:2-(1,2-epoxy-1,2-dihydrophenyl)acetyl-CoA isomerase
MRAYQELPRLLVGLEIPVVAAVNGLAVGGGCALACACDLRIAATTSSFSLSFVARGIGLDLGASFFVSRLVGIGRATQLALTGETIDARNAQEIGLVQSVVPDAELVFEALRLAQGLADQSLAGLAAVKRTIYPGAGDLDAALDLEARTQAAVLAGMQGSTRPIR